MEQLIQERFGAQASAVLKGKYIVAKYIALFSLSRLLH